MVGGSYEAFIGSVHRMGAVLDGQIELVCGAFSSDPEKSKKTGHMLYLDESRAYGSFSEMIEKEAELPEGEGMDFVSIVTPNMAHYQPASEALAKGFPVIIDKPLTFTLAEAHKLRNEVKASGLPFAVTYTYAAYPMIKQARAIRFLNSFVANLVISI